MRFIKTETGDLLNTDNVVEFLIQHDEKEKIYKVVAYVVTKEYLPVYTGSKPKCGFLLDDIQRDSNLGLHKLYTEM